MEKPKKKADNNKSKDENTNEKSDKPKKDDKKKKGKVTFIADCYECCNETELSCNPDGLRPIYCTSCFNKIKKDGINLDKEITKEVIKEV